MINLDKSTLRPWRVWSPEQGRETDVFQYGRTILANIDKDMLMVVANTHYGTHETAEANAALIIFAVNNLDTYKEYVEAYKKMQTILRHRLPMDAGPNDLRALTKPWMQMKQALIRLQQENTNA